MIKNIRNITTAEEFESLPMLGLDDTFEFSCKECGKCCKYNRDDLLLTPYDIFRIASYLRRTPQEILERYCEVYEGHVSRLPVVRVVPVPPNGSCPFLRGKKCVVHAKKPVVCRVYPLARFHTQNEAQYHNSGASCNHNAKSITVREWIADVASEEAEKSGLLWRKIVDYFLPLLEPDKLKVSPDTKELILNTLLISLYLSYSIKEPFLPQLQNNFDKLKKIFEKFYSSIDDGGGYENAF